MQGEVIIIAGYNWEWTVYGLFKCPVGQVSQNLPPHSGRKNGILYQSQKVTIRTY